MGATVTYLLSIGLCLHWVITTRMDSLPRPTLSALPGPVVAKGADVTLRCQGYMRTDKLQLLVDGNLREEKKASRSLAEFLLKWVNDWRDARSYRCRSVQGSSWSELSEPLDLVVMTGTFPPPSISPSPHYITSRGTTVSISCQIPYQAPSLDYSFALLDAKSRNPVKLLSPGGTKAVFSLLSVRAEDSGSYSCIYYQKTAPHRGSHPSQTLQLTVTGPLPKPKFWTPLGLVMAPGANISLWCSRPNLALGEVTFTLRKAGTQEPLEHQTSADLWTSFFLPSLGPEDTGSYSCAYREKSSFGRGSEPSDALELFVQDAAPETSPSVCPSLNVTSGPNVSLLLWGPSWRHSFVLNQEGDEEILSNVETPQDGVQFFLTQVALNHSVNYSCYCLPNTSDAQDIVRGSMPYNTIIITLSCVSFILLLLCLPLLAFLCQGSICKGSLQGDTASRSLCCPYLSLNTCLAQQPEGLREEALNTEVTKERSRRPLVPMAEDIEGVTYTELNKKMLNKWKTDRVKTPRESTTYATVSKD